MTEKERFAVQELRKRMLTDPRKPISPFHADDYALLDCLKLSGFTFNGERVSA